MNVLQPQWRRIAAAVFAGSVLVLAQGCSSTPRPEAEMASASTALTSAENNEAALHAPVAMDRAKEKLRRAQRAMDEKDYAEAKRLSDEAAADAEYAQAFASKTRVETALRELEASIEALRSEIERGQRN
ncbi:DUF4398 domain-containing protein [uncultured Haliea sp.]|mgnify:CR=1 FL=1|uniref:DUF4398 domain-containing protein n=1 Tax=uncultured Haliea sp. TaxID=622616 RepID=UPI00268446AA|tara:strand:+ start:94331 stop:94720 length:390 start_codon:yes stop_codon:yes gene_type:complete